MTAVATGAAIYAESRVWSDERTSRKSSRGSQTVSAAIQVKYDYPARIAADAATLRISCVGETAGWRARVDGFDGWTSGEIDLQASLRAEIPLPVVGENRFRTVLTGPGHPPQTTEISITRTFASSAGVPATLTIYVAVEEDKGRQLLVSYLIFCSCNRDRKKAKKTNICSHRNPKHH